MAMLAEPRRKQKWSVDPRNTAWSNDDSKFGQKMLEKMGWSKGKGLGAQEQGNPEHIRVKVKNDVLGLGATINHEDNWIAHQDDFNQLLAELNNCHGQGETESSVKKKKKTFSLEEKSKSSKNRVHYMKFAKGKDLSSRTEQDLSCIFGRRQKSAKTQPVPELEGISSPGFLTSWEGNLGNVTFPVLCSLCWTVLPLLFKGDIADPDSQEEKNSWLSSPGDGSNTVKSVLTVQEYFAQRMAKLKGSQKETETKVEHSSPAADEAVEPSEELETKVKKKKKKQKRDDEAEWTEDCEKPGKKPKTGSSNGKELDNPLKECHKRKKKRKHKEENEGENISCDENTGSGEISVGMSEGEELSTEEQEEKQKKRHKKKHKKQKEETGESGEGATRKKKKHCKNI
ncbi:PIN2/TERF1-interacting telomerase inhibitor 1 isoform X2 [Parus major]|uniref:PIN2/TERF1-interacting telomerase inhibitor 1 isoform X2 n=1 Tax=Parus major TaxID=9157 RepID=UPI000771440B|nr:PIN2/TERF1-interacting telomerase inhibitor 1 isoform X2 [Parus major]